MASTTRTLLVRIVWEVATTVGARGRRSGTLGKRVLSIRREGVLGVVRIVAKGY